MLFRSNPAYISNSMESPASSPPKSFKATWTSSRHRFEKLGIKPILDFNRIEKDVINFIDKCSHCVSNKDRKEVSASRQIKANVIAFVDRLQTDLTPVQQFHEIELFKIEKRLKLSVLISLANSAEGRMRYIAKLEELLDRVRNLHEYAALHTRGIEYLIAKASFELSQFDVDIKTRTFMKLLACRSFNCLLFSLHVILVGEIVCMHARLFAMLCDESLEILLSERVDNLIKDAELLLERTQVARAERIDFIAKRGIMEAIKAREHDLKIALLRNTQLEAKREGIRVEFTDGFDIKASPLNKSKNKSSNEANQAIDVKIFADLLKNHIDSNIPPPSPSIANMGKKIRNQYKRRSVPSWSQDARTIFRGLKLIAVNSGSRNADDQDNIFTSELETDRGFVQKPEPDDIDEEDFAEIDLDLILQDNPKQITTDNRFIIDFSTHSKISIQSICYSIGDLTQVLFHLFLYKLLYYSYAPLSYRIMNREGYDYKWAGLIYAATPISTALASPLYACMSKNFYRLSFILSLLLLISAAVVFMVAVGVREGSNGLVVLSRILLGLGAGRVLTFSFINRHVVDRQKVRVWSLVVASSAAMMGIGPGISAALESIGDVIARQDMNSGDMPQADRVTFTWGSFINRENIVSFVISCIFLIQIIVFLFKFQDSPHKISSINSTDSNGPGPSEQDQDGVFAFISSITTTSNLKEIAKSLKYEKKRWFWTRIIFSATCFLLAKIIQENLILGLALRLHFIYGKNSVYAGVVLFILTIPNIAASKMLRIFRFKVQERVMLLVTSICMTLSLLIKVRFTAAPVMLEMYLLSLCLTLPISLTYECAANSIMSKVSSVSNSPLFTKSIFPAVIETIGKAAGLIMAVDFYMVDIVLPAISFVLVIILVVLWKHFNLHGFHKFE